MALPQTNQTKPNDMLASSIYVQLSPSLKAGFTVWRLANNFTTEAEAIRHLVRKCIEQNEESQGKTT